MIVMTVDTSVQTLLSGLTEKTELRDQKGQVIGVFTPQKVEEDEAYEWAIAEFNRRGLPLVPPTVNTPGHSHAQVMEHLRSLEKQG